MKNLSKEQIWGIAGSLLFHLLAIAILFLLQLDYPAVEKEKSYVEQFGSAEDFEGKEFLEEIMEQNEPEVNEERPKPQPKPQAKPIVSQTVEKSLPVDTVPVLKKEEKPSKEELKRKKEAEEKKRREEAERKKREAAEKKKLEEKKKQDERNRLAGNAFGKAQKMSAEGKGSSGINKGKEAGGSGSGAKGKSSGNGKVSPNLESRVNTLVSPQGNITQRSCTVVVRVVVAPDGTVRSATIDTGTDTSDLKVRNAALKAARSKNNFKAVNSVDNIEGTITYRFIVN